MKHASQEVKAVRGYIDTDVLFVLLVLFLLLL